MDVSAWHDLAIQNLFPERGQDQFHAELCRLVVDVEDRIDFGDFERHHLLRVRDHLHREVRLTIIGAAAYRSRHSRRFIWVEEVRVKGHGKSVGVFGDDGERFVHDGADAAAVDLLHGEDANAGFLDEFPFLRIDFTNSDHDSVFRPNFRRETEDVRQLDRTVTHDRGHRHAVNVSAG